MLNNIEYQSSLAAISARCRYFCRAASSFLRFRFTLLHCGSAFMSLRHAEARFSFDAAAAAATFSICFDAAIIDYAILMLSLDFSPLLSPRLLALMPLPRRCLLMLRYDCFRCCFAMLIITPPIRYALRFTDIHGVTCRRCHTLAIHVTYEPLTSLPAYSRLFAAILPLRVSMSTMLTLGYTRLMPPCRDAATPRREARRVQRAERRADGGKNMLVASGERYAEERVRGAGARR